MSLKSGDRIKETSTIEGTGTATLLGAAVGFQTFSAVLSDADTCYYCIELGSEWEVGTGTYSAGTLARTTVQSSSNADALVSFSAGTKSVFLTFPALAAQNLAIQPLTGILYVDQNSPAVSPDGSIAAPFTTIQAALDAIGPATSSTEQETFWRLMITGGFYDEDLTIPSLRTITLDCEPRAMLTNNTLTSPRTIIVNSTTASFTPFRIAGLKIENLIMIDGIRLSQNLAGDANFDLEIRNCVFEDAGTAGSQGPSIDAHRWGGGHMRLRAYDSLFRPIDAAFCIDGGVGLDVAIKQAEGCSFDGPIRGAGYGQFSLCTVDGDLTFDAPGGAFSVGDITRPAGFFMCEFNNAIQFTGTQPGDFRVDDVSWKTAKINVTINAPATAANLSDALYSPLNAGDWAAPTPDTIADAIDRIAASIFANHGAIP